MRRVAAFLLILLLTALPGWTQQSKPVENEWPICFDESAWADLESQIQAELELTARDAAKAAVAPYLEYEVKLEAEVKHLTENRNWWRTMAFVGAGATVLVSALFILNAFLPTLTP